MRSLFWRMLILLCIGILLTSQALPSPEAGGATPALATNPHQSPAEDSHAPERADMVVEWRDPVS